MKLFKKNKISIKQDTNPLESKSSANINFNLRDINCAFKLNGYERFDVYKEYNRNPILYTAIDIIKMGFVNIFPALKDRQGEVVNDNEFLQLMESPSSYLTFSEFAERMLVYYIITGNIYISVQILPSGRYANINVLPPHAITINEGISLEYVDSYIYNAGDTGITYSLNKDGRYINKQGNLELFHIKNFDPARPKRGMSIAGTLAKQIELDNNIMVHNNSLLENRATPSMIIENSSDGYLTDEQIFRLKGSLQESYSGYKNSGKPMLLEGGLKVNVVGQSNTDIEILGLKQEAKETIYRALHIPSVYYSEKTSTYNNMETAKISLYDEAILPIWSKIFKELWSLMRYYYDPNNQLYIDYEQDKIEALQPRKMENVKMITEMGIVTINEARRKLGLTDIIGGDVLIDSNNPTAKPIDQVKQENIDIDIALHDSQESNLARLYKMYDEGKINMSKNEIKQYIDNA